MKPIVIIMISMIFLTGCLKKYDTITKLTVSETYWIGAGTNIDGTPINSVTFNFLPLPTDMFVILDGKWYSGTWRDSDNYVKGIFSRIENGLTQTFIFEGVLSYDRKQMQGTFQNFNTTISLAKGTFTLKVTP